CAPRCVVIGSSSGWSLRAYSASVIHTCAAGTLIGKWKLAGITPTIVNGRALIVVVVPTFSGEAPNSERQRPSLITATSAPARSSSGRNDRPATGCTPRVEKISDDTTAPGICIDRP